MNLSDNEKQNVLNILKEFASIQEKIKLNEAVPIENYRYNYLNDERQLLSAVLKKIFSEIKKQNIKISSDLAGACNLAINFKTIPPIERQIIERSKYDLNDYERSHPENSKDFLTLNYKSHLRPCVQLLLFTVLSLDNLNEEFFVTVFQRDKKMALNWLLSELGKIIILENSPKSYKKIERRTNWNRISYLIFEYENWDTEFGPSGGLSRQNILDLFGNLPPQLDESVNQRLISRVREWELFKEKTMASNAPRHQI